MRQQIKELEENPFKECFTLMAHALTDSFTIIIIKSAGNVIRRVPDVLVN